MSGYRKGRKRKDLFILMSLVLTLATEARKEKACVKPSCTGESRYICIRCSDIQRKSMHISVYKDVTVSTSIRCRFMTRPKLSCTMQPETLQGVEKTIRILYYVSDDNILK